MHDVSVYKNVQTRTDVDILIRAISEFGVVETILVIVWCDKWWVSASDHAARNHLENMVT